MIFNLSKIKVSAEKAFEKTVIDLGDSFTEVIETPGYFPDYEGDIVDTGALRDSQIITFKGGLFVDFTWDVPYAAYVHEGYTHVGGKVMPGRPWTQHGLNIFGLTKKFAIHFGKELIKS